MVSNLLDEKLSLVKHSLFRFSLPTSNSSHYSQQFCPNLADFAPKQNDGDPRPTDTHRTKLRLQSSDFTDTVA